jgi:hypothetical protein
MAVLGATSSTYAERRGGALPGGFHAVPAMPPHATAHSAAGASEPATPSFLDSGNADSTLLQKPDEAYTNLPRDRLGKQIGRASCRERVS